MIRLRASSGRFVSIKQLADKLANPTPLLEAVGQLLQESIQARISTTKISPDGVPFAPWSIKTALARQKKGTAARGILNDTGTLLRSIEYQVSQKGVEVGVNGDAPYATYLQNGTRHMPKRPFVGISPQDRENIRAILQSYVQAR